MPNTLFWCCKNSFGIIDLCAMKNLGEKLSAARNAMGYTLRDVADQTRLRTDIIANMESGEFNFNLPEIYRRGFLRIYASFLKLNVDEILAEYAALQASRRGDSRKAKNLLERIAPASPKDVEPPQPMDSRYDTSLEESDDSIPEDQMKYIKLGAVFVGVLLAVAVIVFGISALVRPNAPEENPDINMAASSVSTTTSGQSVSGSGTAGATAAKEYLLGIAATNDTYIKLYYPSDAKNPIYSGLISAGEKKEFKYKTKINLDVTDAQNIEISRNGKKVKLLDAKGAPIRGIHTIKISAKD